MQNADLIMLMAEVSAAVGRDTSTAATRTDTESIANSDANFAKNVFTLCQHLKSSGPHLEHTNKSDLNRAFAALRQACCQDSASLDTTCRLKIMELIELRAMGWRPKLAHTQYYLNRVNNYNNNNVKGVDDENILNEYAHLQSKNINELYTLKTDLISDLNDTKESYQHNIVDLTTNFNNINNNVPYSPTIMRQTKSNNNNIGITTTTNVTNSKMISAMSYNVPPPLLNVPPPLTPPQPQRQQNQPQRQQYNQQHTAPTQPPPPAMFLPPMTTQPPTKAPPLMEMQPNSAGYFIIPATSNWPTAAAQMMSAAAAAAAAAVPFLPQSSQMMRSFPPPPLPIYNNEQLRQNNTIAESLHTATLVPAIPSANGSINMNTISGILSSKSIKSQQFREEMVIRNSDSGKIMGVKGRRVALVEEMSHTIISFQKVESKCKERVLTITGSTPDSIGDAKRLIEETIRRNISPTPPTDREKTVKIDVATSREYFNDATQTAESPKENSSDDDDNISNNNISIQTTKDGTLKLCCDDPQVLAAAQAALSEYLNRAHRNAKFSAEERAQRKERRKSMPLQGSATSTATDTVNESKAKLKRQATISSIVKHDNDTIISKCNEEPESFSSTSTPNLLTTPKMNPTLNANGDKKNWRAQKIETTTARQTRYTRDELITIRGKIPTEPNMALKTTATVGDETKASENNDTIIPQEILRKN